MTNVIKEGATYLYIMESGDYSKVGISSDPEKRRSSIQTSNPLPVSLYKTFYFAERWLAESVEAMAHRQMAIFHSVAKGEWFRALPEDAEKVCLFCISADKAVIHHYHDVASYTSSQGRLDIPERGYDILNFLFRTPLRNVPVLKRDILSRALCIGLEEMLHTEYSLYQNRDK